MARRKWSDLSDRQKTLILTMIAVQISLLLTALADIYRRPVEEIRGSKRVWTAIFFINFVGPVSYFLFGRKR